MTDLTKIEITLGQMARHVDRLATAVERIAAALEKAGVPASGVSDGAMRFMAKNFKAAADLNHRFAQSAPPDWPIKPNPYGVDSW